MLYQLSYARAYTQVGALKCIQGQAASQDCLALIDSEILRPDEAVVPPRSGGGGSTRQPPHTCSR